MYKDKASKATCFIIRYAIMGASVYLCSAVTLLTLSLTCVAGGIVDRDHLTIDRDAFMQLLGRVEHLEKRDQKQQAEIEKLRDELNIEKQENDRLNADQQEEIRKLRDELYTEKQRTSLMEDILTRRMESSVENQHENDDSKTRTGGLVEESDMTETASDDMLTSAPQTGVPAKQELDDERTVRDASPDMHLVTGAQTDKIRRQVEEPVIAFHASLTNYSSHTGVHQSISFDNVVTNIGAAYNPHFGSFVAPVPGVYVFHTTIVIRLHDETHASIVKNGVRIVNMYIRGVESAWGSDTAVAVLHLNKGDDVSVQNIDSDKTIEGSHYSMFSGFLLRQDDSDLSVIGR